MHFTLCADDFALSPAVSQGIIQLINLKRISATSVMSLTPYWPTDGKLLQGLPTMAGLHLTLTDLKPLTKMPHYAPNGKMPSLKQLLIKSHLKLPISEIRNEIKAQLDRFLDILQQNPSHIDGHQHIHVLPRIRDILLDLYLQYFPDKKVMVRSCYNSLSHITKQPSTLKSLIISTLSNTLTKQLKLQQIPCNDHFGGIYDLEENTDYSCVFKKFITNLQPNSLIMCHPGLVDSELKQVDAVTTTRENELNFFKSEVFSKLLQDNNLNLF